MPVARPVRPPKVGSIVPPEALLALFAARNLDGLIDAAFDVLRAAVVCDFASAFYRSAGDGLLKQRDSRGRECEPAFMRRYMELTPALRAAMANPGIRVLTTRTVMPLSDRQLERTAFYREIMQPEGWRHAVALCFWNNPPAKAPIFVTSIYRSEGRSDFSTREIAILEGIHPFLDCSVRRVYEGEAAATVCDGMAMAVHGGEVGFALVDKDLRLVQANLLGRELCATWIKDGVERDSESPFVARFVPYELETTCRELHREWQSLLRDDPDATGMRRQRSVLHPRVPGLTARVTLVCPNSVDLAEPTFLIELEGRVHGADLHTPDQCMPLLQQMTVAERAVAMVLADGLSNQEIADRLGKSIDSVKFLLHRIYQKTGIPSRTALVALLRSRPEEVRRSRAEA